MPLLKFSKPRSLPWFGLSLLALLLVSLSLRFWGLARFNTLVFDEVYYAKFASNYLTGTPFFDGHPPLSKYLIALSIWVGQQLPFAQGPVNDKTGLLLSPWSYRWLNALLGAFIPLVVSGIAYQLTQRRRYSLLAGGLVALDGMLLVESRYALNNIHLVLLGLLALWCSLRGLAQQGRSRHLWLGLSGAFFGSAIAIKWNGLWFLLAAYGLWLLVQGGRWWQARGQESGLTDFWNPQTQLLPRLALVRWWQVGVYWGAVPFLVYYLTWLPHLWFYTEKGFWQLQWEILTYHQRVGSGPDVHPYCSPWYSWLVMWRPVAYFYQVGERGAGGPTGDGGLPLAPGRVIYDVHSMGNPILWWGSTIAILALAFTLMRWALNQARSPQRRPTLTPTDVWLGIFLLMGYGANLLPWARVSRCIFLYHYLGASIFAMMALAWWGDRGLCSEHSDYRRLSIAMLILVGLGFVFWLPLYLGLPLTATGFRLRMWLPSWV